MRTSERAEADGTLKLIPNMDYRDAPSRLSYETKIVKAFDYLRTTKGLEIKALHPPEDLPQEARP